MFPVAVLATVDGADRFKEREERRMGYELEFRSDAESAMER